MRRAALYLQVLTMYLTCMQARGFAKRALRSSSGAGKGKGSGGGSGSGAGKGGKVRAKDGGSGSSGSGGGGGGGGRGRMARRQRAPPPPFPVRYLKGAPGLFLGRETCTIDGVSGAHAPKLDVTYTNDASAVSAWLADALGGGNGVGEGGGVAALGIDTETKPRFSKPVPGTPDLGPALLQLATDDGRCLVVQLSGKSWRHGDTKALVAALQPVLGDAAIPKVDAVGRSVGRSVGR